MFIPYAPYAVGVGVALIVLAVLALSRRKQRVPALAPGSMMRSSEWQILDASYSDRRTHIRREGPPVKILISSPTLHAGVDKGYVIDRSTGGLRIVAEMAMVAGSTLQVRAHHAPDNTPWVTVIVRSCKSVAKHYELGCEFDRTPPWNVLLLFG